MRTQCNNLTMVFPKVPKNFSGCLQHWARSVFLPECEHAMRLRMMQCEGVP